MSKNKDFYAALALFQSLFKSHKGDIYTIIARFILAGVRIENLHSFTISQLERILQRHFSLDIPKSVITRCVINQKTFSYKNESYHVVQADDTETQQLLASLTEVNNQNDDIASELYSFIEHRQLKTLTDDEKEEIRNIFFDFIEDREAQSSHRYFQDVAHFIVTKEEDQSMQESLDAIKEGIIIYRGIRYSESSNSQTWKHDTIFFLDMEYLFAAFGLNGEYYKEFFYDFYNLVKEINDGSPRRNNVPRIQLMYFAKTKAEIEKFFNSAVRMKEGHERPDILSHAMGIIDKECVDALAVMTYKNRFFKFLKDQGITEYPHEISRLKNKDYLFETENLHKKIQEMFEPEEQDDIQYLLDSADNINILREGRGSTRLDDCGCIFLSASRLATRFSKFLRENDQDARTFVMCSMNIFTEEMWFRLRKGIMDTKTVATFKVVSKAKCIVSGLLSDSVARNYEKLKVSGVAEEVHYGLYADLRLRNCAPEHVTSRTIDSDMAYVNEHDYLHVYQEEQAMLRSKADRVDEAEQKLRQSDDDKQLLIDENEKLKRKLHESEYNKLIRARKKAKYKFCFENLIYTNLKCIIWTVLIALVLCSVYAEKAKVPFTVLSGCASILSWLCHIPAKAQKWANVFRLSRYRGYIENELRKILG